MKQLHIWLIEDDDAQSALFRLLAKETHPEVKVTACESGGELIKSISDAPSEVLSDSLILSDLNLPDMTGVELLSTLREEKGLKAVPFLLFSGSSDGKNVESAYLAGANAYIEKPEGIQQFKDLIHSIIAFWSRTL